MRRRRGAPAVAAAAFFAGLCWQGWGAAEARMLQPPPTAAAPAPLPPPGSAPSPILTRPGPLGPSPYGPHPTYPAARYPGPLDQQQMQSYRQNLLDQRRRLELRGVSPASPRYRDIQQQLNQLGR